MTDRQTDEIVSSLSDRFYVFKAIAIVFVTMAHCTYSNNIIETISSLFGTVGVPIFMFVSGFFFSRERKVGEFWRAKIKTIVVPWLIYGTATYILNNILTQGSVDIKSLVFWIFGNGTWLYFVPVLLLCFVLFRISDKKLFHIIVFALFLVCNILCEINIIRDYAFLTRYQILFNWCGFFQIGMFTRKYLIQFVDLVNKRYIKVIVLNLWGAMSVVYPILIHPGYWSCFAFVYETISVFAVFILSGYFVKIKVLNDIGRKTYPIYFLHMQIGIGFVRFLFRLIGIVNYEWPLLIVQPIFVVLSVWVGIKIVEYISKKMHADKIMWIFGIKV